jgi:hypothetical protein
MKWLKTLVQKLGPKRIDHPTFGPLVFMKMSDSSKSYWEGAGTFPATGKKIEYFIDGDENGPHPGAEDFYRDVLTRYTELIEIIRPTLAVEFQQWVGRSLPNDIEKEFTLTSLSIPDVRIKPLMWDISFDCSSSDHLFSVQMSDWSITGATVDG